MDRKVEYAGILTIDDMESAIANAKSMGYKGDARIIPSMPSVRRMNEGSTYSFLQRLRVRERFSLLFEGGPDDCELIVHEGDPIVVPYPGVVRASWPLPKYIIRTSGAGVYEKRSEAEMSKRPEDERNVRGAKYFWLGQDVYPTGAENANDA